MRARVVVFPVRGRNWCFSTSVQPLPSDSAASVTPSTFKDLFSKISFSDSKPFASNAELLIDFVANKMNKAWMGLEKAPEGSLKNKIHGLGLGLLSAVKPSEMFFKSIPKDVTTVEVTYPASLNSRLVRRRLRHIALRGTIIHNRYFYGSVSLLPLTTAFTVLPLPNIPFFWVLFRTYSHWRARQAALMICVTLGLRDFLSEIFEGSELLLQLVSDGSHNSKLSSGEGDELKCNDSEYDAKRLLSSSWVLRPSKELEELIERGFDHDGLSKSAISDICNTFDLNPNDVLKYRDSM